MPFIPDHSKVVTRYILERHARVFPHKECIRFENGERLTYGEALKEAYAAANVLSGHGIKRGEN